ncbi:MAG: polyprenyl diphosphate synthase [Sphaerochaetaceae bacterium]
MESSSHLHPEAEGYPHHIGIIMDGNGRWAKKRALPRTAGHYEGVKAAKRVTTEASRLGIPYLTFYVFSTENWRRPDAEVAYLMNLLSTRIYSELDFYRRLGAKVVFRGATDLLSTDAKEAMAATEEATKDNTHILITLAINYGGQDEIIRAVNRWLKATEKKEELTSTALQQHMDLPFIPPVDLIIRSGGEKRLSNFLLWDAAYAELAFYDSLWPDWGAKELVAACTEFANRERKFGGIPT